MSKNKKAAFKVPGKKKQEHYERVARLQYGPTIVNESTQLWNSYPEARQKAILAEGNKIYSDLAEALKAGKTASSREVQALLEHWHDHLHYFYEPKLEILRGLGELYEESPDFAANFQKLHPDLPAFLHEAITQYVDNLESAGNDQQLNAKQTRQAKS
jgi:hypothetical protein